MDLIGIIKDNWAAIVPVLFQFFTAVVLSFSAGWVAARQRYSDLLESNRERIVHRDEQIADLNRRLDRHASPAIETSQTRVQAVLGLLGEAEIALETVSRSDTAEIEKWRTRWYGAVSALLSSADRGDLMIIFDKEADVGDAFIVDWRGSAEQMMFYIWLSRRVKGLRAVLLLIMSSSG